MENQKSFISIIEQGTVYQLQKVKQLIGSPRFSFLKLNDGERARLATAKEIAIISDVYGIPIITLLIEYKVGIDRKLDELLELKEYDREFLDKVFLETFT
jgi:hypothetical protein